MATYNEVMSRKKSQIVVTRGRLSGPKGGNTRARKPTSEQRSELARKAVLARWAEAKKTGKLTPFERAADEFISEHAELLRLLAE